MSAVEERTGGTDALVGHGRVYVGRREPITYEDWLAYGWSEDEARTHAQREQVESRVYRRAADGSEVRLEGDLEWGYNGSGPHDCARAILFDVLEVEPLRPTVTKFKQSVIAQLPRQGFELAESRVRAWLVEMA